jgi:hypothetical protein
MGVAVQLPTGITFNYSANANATLRQRVYLEGPRLGRIEHSGSGENNTHIGSGKISLGGAGGGSSPVTVSCFHEQEGRWIESPVTHTGPHNDSWGGQLRVYHRVTTEDGVDTDWNDCIIEFFWFLPRNAQEAELNLCVECGCSGFRPSREVPDHCHAPIINGGECPHSYLDHPTSFAEIIPPIVGD